MRGLKTSPRKAKRQVARRFGLPTYAQWLAANDKYRKVEKKLRGQKSVMTGRIRTLDEVRQHVIDEWKSPLANMKSCCNGLFWIEWGLFLFTLGRFWLNIIVITNNFAHRPCAFGDHYYCQDPKPGDHWVWFEYTVAMTEFCGMVLLCFVLGCSIMSFNIDYGGGKPRSLYLSIVAFSAVTQFSMLSAVRLFQPHNVHLALRRTWVLPLPIIVKSFLSFLLLLLIPACVFVVSSKLSQLEQCLVLPLENWTMFPNYFLFFGFLNQLLGITENNQSQTTNVLDLLFLGQDAQITESEEVSRNFILQTVYLEAVGKWGWSGLVFMVNLGSGGWQRIFVIEDVKDSDETDRLLRTGRRRGVSGEYKALPTHQIPSQRVGYGSMISGEGVGDMRGGGVGGVEFDDMSGKEYWITLDHPHKRKNKRNVLGVEMKERSKTTSDYGPSVEFINTQAGDRFRHQSVQILVLNDYNKPLQGYIIPLTTDHRSKQPRDGKVLAPSATARSSRAGSVGYGVPSQGPFCCRGGAADADLKLPWHTAPGQLAVVSKGITMGSPYRLVINFGDLGADGHDALMKIEFTTPIHGDVKLRLRSILHSQELDFKADRDKANTKCCMY
ncbi:hypothetical protein AAMO2058_001430900 [Amorphochlora amoebiformis]